MKEPVKIAFGKHAKVKAIVQAAYPGVSTRRPVKIECATECNVSDYWDGGSRTYVSVVKLDDMTQIPYHSVLQRQEQNNAFKLSAGSLPVEFGYCVVENSIFCGKDMGYTIIMNPVDIPIHIPEAISLLPKVEPDVPIIDEEGFYPQEIPEKF